MTEPDQSCWACALQQIGGVNLLGVCKRQGTDIPGYIVDVGCPWWVEKPVPLVEEPID